MGIAVEEAHGEELQDVGVEKVRGEHRALRGVAHVVHASAAASLLDQDLLGAELFDHVWNHDGRGPGEHLGEAPHVARFLAKVQLPPKVVPHLLHHVGGMVMGQRRRNERDRTHQHHEQPHVLVDTRRDVRPTHLDDYLAAVARACTC